ncbi:MAG TPA: hypothetical protein HPP81_02005 [Deltaproteobacteria bacterium]|jgi:hypothetical protein|nr:hypothetical protein [Deltaproteobacteria bacterium]
MTTLILSWQFPEAGRLYYSGKDPTVGKLLELDQENKTLKSKIAALSADSTNSFKYPGSPADPAPFQTTWISPVQART